MEWLLKFNKIEMILEYLNSHIDQGKSKQQISNICGD